MSNTFLAQFEAGTLRFFPHEDHIRMAWLYLRRDGWDEGYPQIQSGLKHFAATHGQPDKYHETITRFWALLVFHAIESKPEIETFSEFMKTFPILFNKSAIKQHYSDGVLWDDDARHNWVEPDKAPMPE